MFFLVRRSVLGSQDEYQDLDFDSKELIIGSDDGCTISLNDIVSGRLIIKPKNARYARFSCTDDVVLGTDKGEKKSGMLELGGKYKLGIYDIEVIEPPAGFDFAINLTQSKRKNLVKKKKYRLETKKSRFSIRSLSYVLFFSIIVLFLFLPYLTQINSDKKVKSTLPLPTDNSWSSGPLSPAHRIPEIGDDCQVCHVKPFEKVQDKQCLSCHRNLNDHVASNHPAVDELDKFICENCHKEHNEPAQITRTDDALCVDCHQEIDKYVKTGTSGSNVQKVSGFNEKSHPPFRLSLVVPEFKNGNYDWINKRPLFDANKPAKEMSNLKFSHQVHLDVDMVQDEKTGDELVCSDCHQLEADKEHFKPITMDKDCRSCHKLTFDVFNPDLELPHGDLRAAYVMLQAHYIREFTDPELREKRARYKKRRIPGKHTNAINCQGSGLNCGRKEAAKEAEFQFTNSGCITCHEVTENVKADPINKWFVKPIRINADWYTQAKFDHVSHLSVKDLNKDDVCLTCHHVKLSDSSTDIAMPKQGKCLECHEQSDKLSVELSCIRCHEFHIENNDEKKQEN